VNNTLAAIFSRIPAFQDAESFIDVMRPWTYAGIYLCSIVFVAATIVLLASQDKTQTTDN
jgi:hypothetical protein